MDAKLQQLRELSYLLPPRIESLIGGSVPLVTQSSEEKAIPSGRRRNDDTSGESPQPQTARQLPVLDQGPIGLFRRSSSEREQAVVVCRTSRWRSSCLDAEVHYCR